MNSESVYTWEEFYQVYMHPADCGSYEKWEEEMLNGEVKFGLEGEEEYNYIREKKENKTSDVYAAFAQYGWKGKKSDKNLF